MAVMRRAVFLDKDGPLIDKVPYNVDPLRVTLARDAGGALRALKSHGFLLVVVSNQPGVALARFSLQSLASVERRIQELLAMSAVEIDAFYYDILDDVEAGNRASCRTVLVDTGSETTWRLGLHRQPHLLAGSLGQAARLILAPAGRAPRDPGGDGNEFDMASQA